MGEPGDTPNVSTDESVVVVVAGGPLDDPAPQPFGPSGWPGDVVVVAADSGVDRARAAGWPVHRVVGDLDSVTDDGLAWARAGGAVMEVHEPDKDATDLELAIDTALALDPSRLCVVGASGGRLDLQLIDLLLLAGPRLATVDVTGWFGPAKVTVVRPGRGRRLTGCTRDVVTLVPVHGPVGGVTTGGLRWPLADGTLVPATSRAASNELVGTTATVSCRSGVLLAIQPGMTAPDTAPRTGRYDPTPRGASGGSQT